MNQKGILSGVVAAAAVLLIGAVLITTSASVKSINQENFSEKIFDAKKEWNSTRYLLDKTLSDRLADSSAGCGWNAPDETGIGAYFTGTINNAKKSCAFSDVAITSSAQANFVVSVKITCSKKISSEFEIKKFEKTAVFKKSVVFGGPPCTITVTDQDSSTNEVTWP